MPRVYHITCLLFGVLCPILFMACENAGKTESGTKAKSEVPSKPRGTKVNLDDLPKTLSQYPYIHHRDNEGTKAQVGDEVAYHQIVMKNDTLLQSSYYFGAPRKIVLPSRDSVASPPPPSYDALLLMSPGDSMTLYQLLTDFEPSKLPPGVSTNDTFIYHIRLESITPAVEVEKRRQALLNRNTSVTDSLNDYRQRWINNKKIKGLQKMESGLQYLIHKQGKGEAIKDGQYLEAHYIGMLKDGKVFDSSFRKFQPFVFSVGRKNVIAGWDEAIPLLHVGGSMTLFVPSYMAYGVKGSPPDIPPNADLIFFIEVIGKRF